MLTKEECLKALDFIEEETTVIEDYETMPFITCNHLQKEIAILRQLVNEHFDNPTLKWEELKEGMWVWDSYRKLWFTVDAMFTNPDTKIKYFMDFRSVIEFEENRLYRKQVE